MLASSQIENLKKEISFKTSRSGGKGGQNVNKVETKVELLFDLNASETLNATQKYLILTKLGNRINELGVLRISEESSRSQMMNKELAIEHFFELINKALIRPKVRKATKPSKSSKLKKLQGKKRRGEIKQWRKKPF